MKFYVIVEKGFSREYTSQTYPYGYKPAREMEGHIFEVNVYGFARHVADFKEEGTNCADTYFIKLVEIRYGVGHPKHGEVLRVQDGDLQETPQGG